MILPAPMLLDERRIPPFAEPGWIYELKFHGYRIVAGIDNGAVQLATKNGADATKWFPEVVEGLSMISGGPHILDGEVCVLDELGRSDFNQLQDRARRRRFYEGCDAVTFCAFDLLRVNGKSLINEPVEHRKGLLQPLLTPPPKSVLYVGHFEPEEGRRIFEQAKGLMLEGLVAKKLGSVYKPGERSSDWTKVKRKGAVPAERFKRS